MVQVLNYKRNVNLFNKGNPDRDDHVLNTIGIGKAVINVLVPNVVGMSLTSATAALTLAGLAIHAFGDTTAVAVSQSPAANATVAPHSTVNVVFGAYAELVTNGTFNTDLAGWLDISQAPSQILWNASGKVMLRALDDFTLAGLSQHIILPVVNLNKPHKIMVDISSFNSGGGYVGEFMVGGLGQPFEYVNYAINTQGHFETVFYPTGLDIVIRSAIRGSGSSFMLDNISLKRQDV